LSACQAEGSSVEGPSWAPDWSIDANFSPLRPIASWEDDESPSLEFYAAGDFSAHVKVSDDLQELKLQGLRN